MHDEHNRNLNIFGAIVFTFGLIVLAMYVFASLR